jgi:hypothetical protein
MILYDFGLAERVDELLTAEKVDPAYARAIAASHYGSASPTEFDRADAMFQVLWSKVSAVVCTYGAEPFDPADVPTRPADVEPARTADTSPEAPSGHVTVELLVTGLRAPGAPSSSLLDHERAPATA